MIVVVSNTSPLNYLVLIKQEEILPALFDDIVAPPAVVSELSREDTPEVVREWMNNRPAWLRVETPKRVDPTCRRIRGSWFEPRKGAQGCPAPGWQLHVVAVGE